MSDDDQDAPDRQLAIPAEADGPPARRRLMTASNVIDFAAIPPAEGFDTMGDFAAEVARLAALPAHEYERARKAEAKRLGVRVSAARRPGQGRCARRRRATAARARRSCCPRSSCGPTPVDGAELLADLVAQIRRFIMLRRARGAWRSRCGSSSPTRTPRRSTARGWPCCSPVHRCGKSTLLRVVGMLVVRKVVRVERHGVGDLQADQRGRRRLSCS